MNYKLEDIEGIGAVMAEKLKAVDVDNTTELLAAAATPGGRKKLAETSGISPKLILTFANRADLMRISGISSQFSELLNVAGVDTVKELRTRNAGNLSSKMKECNEQRNLCKASPSETTVQKWIDAAKDLEAVLTY